MTLSPSERQSAPQSFDLALSCAMALMALLVCFSVWLSLTGSEPLIIAPQIGGLNACLDLVPPSAGQPIDESCSGPQGSAAAFIKQDLQKLGPRQSPNGRFQVGYTFVLTLLDFFHRDDKGLWSINPTAVQRVVNTIEQVDRPVVLYFYSTHFHQGSDLEPVLAADPSNMAFSPQGPLPVDSYMGESLYPWSIARTDNAITERRVQAINALTEAICRLPSSTRARIIGLNVLGEIHHMFPNFETAMGITVTPYVVSDYSSASREGFRAALQRRFHSIAALNSAIGASFTSFDQIEPPAGEQQGAPLWRQLDAFSLGRVPLSGWLRDRTRPSPDDDHVARPWVRIYLDGHSAGRALVYYDRHDVREALPQMDALGTGWRIDLDYRQWSVGAHRIDFALERPTGQEGAVELIHLAKRNVYVFGADRADQSADDIPKEAAVVHDMPPMQEANNSVQFWIDEPTNDLKLRYNRLAELWQQYRSEQVLSYLTYFNHQFNGTCLASVERRTQQIYPATGAGWDASRLAASESRKPFDNLSLGVNLYGEATDDPAFFDALARTRQMHYSVTEFHPMRALTAPQLLQLLNHHRDHGVHTLSFFLHPNRIDASGKSVNINPLSFDPGNPAHGSDALYRSLQQILEGRF